MCNTAKVQMPPESFIHAPSPFFFFFFKYNNAHVNVRLKVNRKLLNKSVYLNLATCLSRWCFCV